MDLYFSPLACSLASRIAVYEAGAEGSVALRQVDTKTQTTVDGADYRAINPKGMVPALRTPDGDILTENAAILPFLADQFPAANLAPAGGIERSRLAQWLSFIGSELHKSVFTPLLSPKANEGAKTYARGAADSRLAYLDAHLEGRDYLLDRFSVADAYLTAVLNWAPFVGIDLKAWPSVAAYYARVTARPHVARALLEEMGLFKAA
ncbi:glutathione binding-like protein [soil metagenome]